MVSVGGSSVRLLQDGGDLDDLPTDLVFNSSRVGSLSPEVCGFGALRILSVLLRTFCSGRIPVVSWPVFSDLPPPVGLFASFVCGFVVVCGLGWDALNCSFGVTKEGFGEQFHLLRRLRCGFFTHSM